MKNKVLCIILTVLILLLFFTACSKTPTDTPTESPTKEPTPAATEGEGEETDEPPETEELEYVELIWYIAGDAAKDEEMVMEELNKYIKEKINATVDIRWISFGDYQQRMSIIVGAGEEFDLCFVATTYFNPVVNAQNGAFLPLDDLLPKYAPNLLKEVPEWVIEGAKIAGKVYVIPSYKDVADVFSIVFNKTMADEIGVDLSSSWRTMFNLDERFYKFKELRDEKYPEKADIPLMSPYRTMGAWLPCDIFIGPAVANIEGIEIFKGKGKGELVFNMYDTDEYREMMRLQKKWVDDGIAAYDAKNFDPDGVLHKAGEIPIRMGQGLVAIDPHHYSTEWEADIVASDISIPSTAYLHAAATAVSVTSKNSERALMLQDLVYADEYVATTMRFGLEGEDLHYVIDEDGRLDFSKGRNADPQNRGIFRWYGSQFGNLFKAIMPNTQPKDLYEQIMASNDRSTQFTANLGFVVNQDPIANEIAACANVIAEYHEPLAYGMVDDVDTHLNEFVQKLNNNGVDKIIEEVQKQLNDWRVSVGREVLAD
ncbi:MAG: ABC transporter substrate-binding protein [Caldicoprobacterales bacterium]